MSTKRFCDVCGKSVGENFDYAVAIGAFLGQAEINVAVSFSRRSCGPNRWEACDLCQQCKERALRLAIDHLRVLSRKTPIVHYSQTTDEA